MQPTTKEMRRTVTRPMIVGALTALLVAGSIAGQAAPAGAEGIRWHTSLDDALKASKESGKLVMLTLHTEWCGYCKLLADETWPAKAVIEKSAGFECVSLDPEKVEVSDKYDDGSYPRTLFLTEEGEIVTEIGGYLDPEPFAKEMERAQASLAKLREAQELEAKVEDPESDPAIAAKVGAIYAELGQAKKALLWLKPAYEQREKLPEQDRASIAVDYGTSLVLDLQYEAAAPVLQELLKSRPGHERAREARHALGYALANMDKLAEAREMWRKVADESTDDWLGKDAQEKVERINEMLGDK